MRLAGVLALAAITLGAASSPVHAQAPSPSPIVFVMDISGSMAEDDGTGTVKINGAKAVLQNILSTTGVEPGTPIGLRTYPDQAGESCNSGKLRFDITPRDPASMSALIRSMRPDGDTPTAETLRAAADDLRAAGYERGTLVLVSDGESTCAPPCDAANELAAAGIVHTVVIGFNISDAGREELQCIADATNGTYLDVGDAEGLADEFDRLSRPGLSIELDYPSEVIAEAGSAAAGVVQLTATVTNTSEQAARNAVAMLRFDDLGPSVIQPVIHLGNLEPGASREVAWTFQPGVAFAGQVISFAVVGRAANLLSDVEARGSITVSDQSDRAHSGPILRGRTQIAILGDSYSSGEGADSYLPGTDTQENSCHRSASTYLIESFDLPDSSVVACSGAVANDVFFGQADNNVTAQLDQLKTLVDTRGVDAVVLTLGGNDAGFGKIAEACVLDDCDVEVDGVPTRRFVDPRVAGLASSLPAAYVGINNALNNRRAVERRGSVAPILVLAYPPAVPLTRRRCLPMLNRFSADEIDFVWRFATAEVNAGVEAAVLAARDRGVPVFYVPDIEYAFQPNHSVCDGQPYARALNSFNFAGFDLLRFPFWSLSDWASFAGRSLRELLHPNREGYRAMTRAIVRWSLTPEAETAEAFLSTARPAEEAVPATAASSIDLGRLGRETVPTLARGTSYALTTGGFEPGSLVEVVLRSELRVLGVIEADPEGMIETRVGIPFDVAAGRHTIEVVGGGIEGERHIVVIPVRVAGDGMPAELRAVALGTTGAGAAALLVALAAGVSYLRLRRAKPRGETTA